MEITLRINIRYLLSQKIKTGLIKLYANYVRINDYNTVICELFF